MRAIWAVPVIASILILGTLGLTQAFAAINISANPIIDPIFKPINFTVTNTGKNPVTVTEITIQLDQDPTVKKTQPFTFVLNTFLKPLESFFFAPELKTIDGDPVDVGKRTLVEVTGEEAEPNTRDPTDPKIKKIKAKKKI